MNYLNLIRYKNLLFIALVQIFIKYGLFHPFGIDITLNAFGFSLLVIATLCIAAGGYIINDVFDIEIDKVNRPKKVFIPNKISEKTAYNLFIIFNVIGVGIGFYLSNMIERPGFSALFIAFSALLYLYSSYLKSTILVGNILIAVLVAMSLILVGLFDLLPAITPENQATQSTFFSIVLDYALFAFYLTLLREIVKDLEDVNGDRKGGLSTLPLAIGRKRSIYVIFGSGVVGVFSVVYYMYQYIYNHQYLLLYFLFGILAPLLFFCVKTWSANSIKDYRFLSNLLKIIMLLGMCSILLFQYTILEK